MSARTSADKPSAELLESVVNRIADSISVVDRDMRFLYANRVLDVATGIPAEKWIGHSSAELGFPKEICEQWERTFRQVFESGKTVRSEYTLNTTFGTLTLQASASPIRDRQGQVHQIVTVSRDITELRKAIRQSQLSQEQLNLTLNSSQLGMWDWDAVTGEIKCDARYAELLGEDPATFLRTNIQAVNARMHDDDRAAVVATVTEHLHGRTPFYRVEARLRLRDGGWKWLATYGQIVQRDAQGKVLRITGTNQDIDALKRAELERQALTDRLQRQSLEDALTGTLNRGGLEERLKSLLDRTRSAGGAHALCHLDLNQFKQVNDSGGHAAGDELLRQVTALLRSVLSPRDLIARIGGDEFGLVLLDCPVDEARQRVERIRQAIEAYRFAWGGTVYAVGASLGVVPISQDSDDAQALLSSADAACRIAKGSSGARVHVALPNDEQVRQHRSQLRWASRIREALEQDRFRLKVEPIAPLSSNPRGRLRAEVLVRMLDASGAEVSPGLFIPSAERYRMMGEVDLWVLRHLLRYCVGPGAALMRESGAMIAVNLSGNSLGSPQLYENIAAALREYGVPASRICFEVTETTAISNLAESSRLMKKLKDLGCQFSLDDFGSGMSSFGYLKSLPVDYLKIDGSFIKAMPTDPLSRNIILAVSQIGHSLGLEVIAEHVETPELLDAVRVLGLDFAQGYAISRPKPIEDLADVLKLAVA